MKFFSKAFWKGFSTWFNIWPYHGSIKIKTNEEAFKEDYEKIADDWKQIGNDIRVSIEKFKKEHYVD